MNTFPVFSSHFFDPEYLTVPFGVSRSITRGSNWKIDYLQYRVFGVRVFKVKEFKSWK